MKSVLIFALSFLMLQPCSAFAQDGSLDLTFGSGGAVVTNFSANGVDLAGLAIQADGKIVAAGSSVSFFPVETEAGILTRYDTNGSLDPAFGVNGKVFGRFSDRTYFAALALQPDGKILVLGGNSPTNLGGFMARYNSDGTLDTTFGDGSTGNIVIWPQTASALAPQSDGKIIVALRADPGRGPGLLRFTKDGTLDSSFGSGGRVEFIGVDEVWVPALKIQPDGKIVAVGGMGRNFTLARYDDDGTLDQMFGVGGIVQTDILGGYEPGPVRAQAERLAIQADGRIVVNGYALTNPDVGSNSVSYIGRVRYNSDGTLDPTFGAGGSRVIAQGGWVSGLAIQADGKIVEAGALPTPAGWPEFGLARFEADGAPDLTFGNKGIVNTTVGSECSGASALAIQPDGKILAGGMSSFGWACTTDFFIVRYNNDDSVPVTGVRFDPKCVRPEESFTATFSGPSVGDDTYFDLRFVSPSNDREEIARNWQQGSLARHVVAADTTPGTWTITGVRGHRVANASSGGFTTVSAGLNVSASSCTD